MFDFDSSGVESLELGSRRRPVKWAVELSLADCRPQKHKARRRQQGPGADSAPGDSQPAAEQPQHAQVQQQAQAQRVAAHRKHLEELVLSQEQDPAEVTPAQAKYKKEFRDARVVCLSTEIEQGNVEYKYRLTGCVTNENRRHQLVTQMKFRLSEGSGECFYYLGVEDDGYPRGLEPQELQDSIAVINRMAISLQATARLVEFVPGGFGRTAALLHIKADAEEDMRATDSRVAVAGSMDSGKSTLVAALTHGADGRPLLDNGRGSARMAVFRHKHEIESGRTSSISQQVLGYDDEGRVLNYVGVATPTPADITAAATHIVNFIDMGGHEKYLKTTLYGMTCLLPDYALLCVDAATGVTRITREHLAVAVALEVPTALVVTKADAVDDQQLQHVLEQLHQLMAPVLHNFGQPEPAHQQPWQQQEGGSSSSSNATGRAGSGASGGGSSSGVPLVESEAQAVALAAGLSELHSCTAAPAAPSFQQAVFPVFVVSCVSGAGVPLLHAFLANLKPLQEHKQTSSSKSSSGSDAVAAATNGAVQAGQVAAGSAVDRSAEAATRPALSQQQQQEQHQVAAGVKPSSSQLWVVSPKKHPPAAPTPMSPVHPSAAPAAVAAAAAVAPVPAGLLPSAPQAQQAAAAAEGVPGPGAGEDESSGRRGHFQVVHTYDVEGVGWVVSGIAVTGTVEVGQSLLWGPTPEGGFSPVRVTCIQRSHVPVRQIAPGQTATLALQPTAPGLPHSGSRQALLTAAAVAQAAAAEAAAREAAAAIAAVPEPTAKTRRRSPAALKAAAAAAAHTAAAAAAAADAARRAASTSGGQAWWVHERQAFSCACGSAAKQESPPVATGGQNGTQQRQGCTAATASAAAADSVADLLDDDFAAGLAADEGSGSGSDSEGDLFGAALEQLQQPQQCRGVPAKGVPVVAAAGAAAGSPVNVAAGLEQEAEEDMFAGLEGVFEDADGEEQASPGSRRSSSGSSSRSSSGLANSWSFSSASSSSGRQYGSAAHGAAGACSRPVPAPAAVGVALSVPGGSRNLSVLSHSSSEQLLGCSPSRWRTKGGVLLDAGAAPHTYWEFEALLVLLGGFWPARGLLSGSWPPAGEEAPAADTAESARSPAAAAGGGAGGVHAGDSLCLHAKKGEGLELASEQQSQHRGRKQRRGSKRYEFTVHCNSIRQTARVVSMRELRSAWQGDARDGEGDEDDDDDQQQQQQQDLQHHCGLTVSIRAAAALLQGASAVHSDREGSSDCASGDSSGDGSRRPRQRRLGSTAASPAAAGAAAGSSGASRRASDAGSVVAVRLRFTHRPEWLQVGARLIVRDRSDGHVAAAGFVTQLLARHTQLQQHHRQTAEAQQPAGRSKGLESLV